VFVSAADPNGDGHAEIITSPDFMGGPDVRVFDAGNTTGVPNQEFLAYDQHFLGGVRTAAGIILGHAYIVTAPGFSGGPDIRVFDSTAPGIPMIVHFFAYNPAFTGGVFVAVGDVNNDGTPDIITAPGAGGGPEVKAFSGAALAMNQVSVLDDFFAYDPRFLGGVRVAATDVNGDGKADIITGAGPGGGPHVRIFDGGTGQQLEMNAVDSFIAYDPTFTGGVFVGGK
jgi:hypothetical protein